MRQLEFIWREAEECGLVLNYEGLNGWSSDFEHEAGAEHLAVLIPEEGRVYKRTIGSLYGEMFLPSFSSGHLLVGSGNIFQLSTQLLLWTEAATDL